MVGGVVVGGFVVGGVVVAGAPAQATTSDTIINIAANNHSKRNRDLRFTDVTS